MTDKEPTQQEIIESTIDEVRLVTTLVVSIGSGLQSTGVQSLAVTIGVAAAVEHFAAQLLEQQYRQNGEKGAALVMQRMDEMLTELRKALREQLKAATWGATATRN